MFHSSRSGQIAIDEAVASMQEKEEAKSLLKKSFREPSVEGDHKEACLGSRRKRQRAVGRGPGDEWIRTFAVITTDANALVTEIHDRMPLILAPDPADLMRPFPAEYRRG
jgi:putative SOS response-associated peptidase YedK